MSTGKGLYKNDRCIKINTIKYLIVFILMFIFITRICIQNAYADNENVTSKN